MGLLSPIGNHVHSLTGSMQTGRSGVRQMTDWDRIQGLRTGVAGVCEEVDEKLIPRENRRTMGRVGVLAALSAKDAIIDAGLEQDDLSSRDCGISFGSTSGSSLTLEKYFTHIFTHKSLLGIRASDYIHIMSHTCAANLAILLKAKGPVVASCTACVSGSQGIGYGFEQIQLGNAQIMICGGAEEMHYMNGAIFDVMRATSTHYNNEPTKTPRPFDQNRDGLVVSEGAGCMILEDWDHAKKRAARIHAEILAFGNNCDGSHITSSEKEGIVGAITLALSYAGLTAGDIGYINAHATGTPVGDVTESAAIHRLFKNNVPVSSLKGHMGHTLGASGAIESIATVAMMHQGFVAPTLNLYKVDSQCAPLDYVMGGPREHSFSIAMNNNFAFGGLNTSLIFRKV